VSPELYRAEQAGRADLADLKVLGIWRLMNLREYHRDGAYFEPAGLTLRHRPMVAGWVFV